MPIPETLIPEPACLSRLHYIGTFLFLNRFNFLTTNRYSFVISKKKKNVTATVKLTRQLQRAFFTFFNVLQFFPARRNSCLSAREKKKTRAQLRSKKYYEPAS